MAGKKRGPKPKSRPSAPASSGEIRPPAHLSEVARRHWRETVTKLRAAGMLADLDAAAMEQYCSLYARWRQAEEEVESTGPIVELPNGISAINPSVKISLQCQAQMKFYLDRFGLSPGARSKIKVDDAEPADDKWAFLDVHAG